jgi:hypothetical protein
VVAHYRPPVPTTGTHFAILFHTSASEEKVSFGGEFLSATEFCESEMTEGVLILNWSYTHPSKIHAGIDECITVQPPTLLQWFESIKPSNEKRGNALELGTHRVTGSGATVLLAETHTRLCSSTSDFVRSISTFLRAARFEHIRNDAEARAFTYSLSAAS